MALRFLIVLIMFALCLPAEAQQKNVPRIGFLSATSPSTISARTDAFRQGLRDLGYVEGKNIVIEWRYAEGKMDRLPDLASEACRQSCAARQEYYRIVRSRARVERKTTGASEGDRSQALPSGLHWEFERTGRYPSVERDETRRRGFRGAASIPGDTRFRGHCDRIP